MDKQHHQLPSFMPLPINCLIFYTSHPNTPQPSASSASPQSQLVVVYPKECNEYNAECQGLLLQYSLYCSEQNLTNSNLIILPILILMTKALTLAVYCNGGNIIQLHDRFINIFDHSPEGKDASKGQRSKGPKPQQSEHLLHFANLAAENGWNEPALIAIFHQGLRQDTQSLELVIATLNTLINTQPGRKDNPFLGVNQPALQTLVTLVPPLKVCLHCREVGLLFYCGESPCTQPTLTPESQLKGESV